MTSASYLSQHSQAVRLPSPLSAPTPPRTTTRRPKATQPQASLIGPAARPITPHNSAIERRITYFAAFVFLIALFVAAIFIPQPTLFQFHVFKTILALSAAAIGGLIPGFIVLRYQKSVRAGGAVALFVLVYLFDPAGRLANDVTVYVPAGASTADTEVPIASPTPDMVNALIEELSTGRDLIANSSRNLSTDLSRCRARPNRCTIATSSNLTLPSINPPEIAFLSDDPKPATANDQPIVSIRTTGNNSPVVTNSQGVTITINEAKD